MQVTGADKAQVQVKNLGDRIKNLKDKRVAVLESGASPSSKRVRDLDARIKALKAKQVAVKENGATPSAGRVRALDARIKALKAKQVAVKENGAAGSAGRVAALQARINALRNKQVDIVTNMTTNIRVNRYQVGGASPGTMSANPTHRADGGSVPKTGMGYADRHHYLLADGEEVISNRRGQADKWRPLLKVINANRLANGGTTGLANGGTAVSGGTGTTSISVVFPTPTILKASVAAGEKLAVSAASAARSAKEVRDSRLADLNYQQRIRDITAELKKTEKIAGKDGKDDNTKKKGMQDTHKTVLALRGLNRTVAWAELTAAKAEQLEARAQSALDATLALREKREAATATLSGTVDIFARSSPASSVAYMNRQIAEIASYGDVMARLKSAKASPALLAQMDAKAMSGDIKSAVRFGKALLAQPALLGQMNASLSTLGQVSANVATMTTDPRFSASTAWNPTSQVVKQAVIQLQADPSTWMTELVARTKYAVVQEMAG